MVQIGGVQDVPEQPCSEQRVWSRTVHVVWRHSSWQQASHLVLQAHLLQEEQDAWDRMVTLAGRVWRDPGAD